LYVSAKQEKAVRRKILHDKKAFNTSIVLASVNIPNVSSSQERDEFIEKALLNVEIQTDEGAEGIITPHLLEQLLQYAPDQDEVRMTCNVMSNFDITCIHSKF